MLTGELKNKVDKIWESFWTGGITNPLDVIEQFTYLMYMKQLDEAETKNEADAELFGMEYEGLFPKDKPYLRWHHFKDIGSADKMYQIMSDELFPFIKNLKGDGESSYARFMRDAIFKIPTANLLQKVVTGIEGLNTEEADIKGDLYEYLLNKLNNSGTNGQFRTPRHIINMMVNLVKPVPTDTICDPAMGTAGFLIGAEEYLRDKHEELFLDDKLLEHFNNKMFNGFDMDSTMLRIGAMNLISHYVDNPQIEYRDSLSQQNIDENKYSLILANPPFKGSLDYEVVAENLALLDEAVKARFVEMFGDPVINSCQFPVQPMTDICDIIDGDRGKNYPKSEEILDDGYCLFLNAKNVTQKVFDFESCNFITREKDDALRNGKLLRGDVVLTTRGTVGNLAFYSKNVPYDNIRINSGMVILRMNRSILNEIYFIELFKMKLSDIKEKIASGSAQPQLPISTMNKIVLMIPPLELQNQFASFVKEIDKSRLLNNHSLLLLKSIIF